MEHLISVVHSIILSFICIEMDQKLQVEFSNSIMLQLHEMEILRLQDKIHQV